MDTYALLRLGHVVGAILLGGGLLAVFISELRAWRTDDVRVFAEAAWYTATFYDGLVVPGALLLGASGLLLKLELGLGWFEEPWFVGMWGLFLFEVVEGNTVTRAQFRRALRRSRAALTAGSLTPEVRAETRSLLGQITHFLDLPLFLVIVWCGVIRPGRWSEVITAVVVALVTAALLTAAVPRLARRDRSRRSLKRTRLAAVRARDNDPARAHEPGRSPNREDAMDDLKLRAANLHRDALVWDSHSCLPLHPDADVGALERHRAAGVDFVSVNIGMDMNPLEQIMAVIASFRAQLRARPERFVPVEDARDVERAKAEGKLAVAFDLEGGVPLGERPEMVQLFYDLGVRQIHLAYNRNNSIGGGCYDHDVPLSDLGRRVVRAINAAGMLMDCSHTGYRTSMDIMALSDGPVIYSHANPLALAANGRNIRDDQIDACVATGGIVCVNGIGRFLGDPEASTPAILRHVDYLVQRVGADHVGLGLDYEYDLGLDQDPPGYDRAYWFPPEHGYGKGSRLRIAVPEQFPEITEGLLGMGYAEADVRRILGENMLALARRVWRPRRSD